DHASHATAFDNQSQFARTAPFRALPHSPRQLPDHRMVGSCQVPQVRGHPLTRSFTSRPPARLSWSLLNAWCSVSRFVMTLRHSLNALRRTAELYVRYTSLARSSGLLAGPLQLHGNLDVDWTAGVIHATPTRLADLLCWGDAVEGRADLPGCRGPRGRAPDAITHPRPGGARA